MCLHRLGFSLPTRVRQIIWQMSVCLLRAALIVLLKSADRFAATIDGLVILSIITRYDGLWLKKLFRGRRCFSAQLHTSRARAHTELHQSVSLSLGTLTTANNILFNIIFQFYLNMYKLLFYSLCIYCAEFTIHFSGFFFISLLWLNFILICI